MSLPRLLLCLLAAALVGCKKPAPSRPSQAGQDASHADAARADAAQASAASAPIEADAGGARVASAEHGAALYARMCAVCHGEEGQGYVADQAPALAQPDFLASVSDDFLRFAIAVGRGSSTMSAWQVDHGGPLTPDDVGDVIAHLRSWQKEPTALPDSATLRGDSGRGKRLFKQHCESCHGPKAKYVHVLNRQLLVYATPAFLRRAIKAGRPPTPMQAFAERLGEQGVEDIVSYLRSLPSWPVQGEVPGAANPPPIPLGPVPLHPKGREPRGFQVFPSNTSVGVIGPELARGARMVLLDARPPSDYIASHIAGAVSVPFFDPAPYLNALPKDAWLVCYCGCPHAESSSLARQLLEAGFRKVTVMDEGLGGWTGEGYEMRSGLEP